MAVRPASPPEAALPRSAPACGGRACLGAVKPRLLRPQSALLPSPPRAGTTQGHVLPNAPMNVQSSPMDGPINAHFTGNPSKTHLHRSNDRSPMNARLSLHTRAGEREPGRRHSNVTSAAALGRQWRSTPACAVLNAVVVLGTLKGALEPERCAEERQTSAVRRDSHPNAVARRGRADAVH